MSSVHDNFIASYEINFEKNEIIFHTIYKDSSTIEHTDILFKGVIFHCLNDASEQNIIFDIVEVDAIDIYDELEELIDNKKKWNWTFRYKDKNEFIEYIIDHKLKFFQIDSSSGLNGY